jgi:hypothetical protein
MRKRNPFRSIGGGRFNPRGAAQQQQSSVIPSSSEIRKIVGASNRFGNPGIKNQQLTTFEVFHYLPVASNVTLDFFRNVNTSVFPFANIQENRLQVGETMVINRIYFDVIGVKTATGAIEEVSTLEVSFPTAYLSQFSWLNDNNRVLKDLSLTNFKPAHNRKGWNEVNDVMHLETDITIQPLMRFVCKLQVPIVTLPVKEGVTYYIGCHAQGTGTLLAPKTTY